MGEELLAGAEVQADHSKMNKRLFLLLVVLFSLNFAAAYPVNIQLNGNMNFNAAVYYCGTDSSCATSTLSSSASGNPILYQITNQGAGTQYFAEYDYVSDRCHVSHSYKNWFDENTGAGPWQYTITFAKQNSCQSNINSVNFAPQIFDNQQQNITINVRSPLNLNAQGPSAVPLSLQYYYSTNVTVLLTIRNATSAVYSASQNAGILWSTNRNFNFLVPLLPAGNYIIETKTRVVDCMCTNYAEQQSNNSFTIVQNTAPSVSIISPPNNSNFTINDTINFAGSATDAEDGSLSGTSLQWYSNLQGDIGQGNNFSRTLNAGLHRITLVATDSGSLNNSASVWINVSTAPVPPQPPQPQQLSANFTFSPSNPTTSQIVTFDGSSSIGNITSYFWDFNDSTNATGVIVTHTFNTTRNYSITLTVTDNKSNTSSFNLIVPVTSQAQPPTPTQQEEPSKKKKEYIDNVDLRSFNLDANCAGTSQIGIELYNNQHEELHDAYLIAEIPELNIKERSQIFNLHGRENRIIVIDVTLPRVSSDYNAHIYLYKSNKFVEFLRIIQISCAEASVGSEGNQTGTRIGGVSAFTSSTESGKQAGTGLTGFVINVGKGLGSRLNQILLLLVIIAAIAVYFTARRK